LLPPRPNLKLKDHPFSAVRDCLFDIFAATLNVWRPSPPSAILEYAMLIPFDVITSKYQTKSRVNGKILLPYTKKQKRKRKTDKRPKEQI